MLLLNLQFILEDGYHSVSIIFFLKLIFNLGVQLSDRILKTRYNILSIVGTSERELLLYFILHGIRDTTTFTNASSLELVFEIGLLQFKLLPQLRDGGVAILEFHLRSFMQVL